MLQEQEFASKKLKSSKLIRVAVCLLLICIAILDQSAQGDSRIHFHYAGAGIELEDFTVPVTLLWADLMIMLNLPADDTLFWTTRASWEKNMRNAKGHAMCCQEDLTDMFSRIQDDELEWVVVFDSSDQFPETAEAERNE
jgi:hypothetical protein